MTHEHEIILVENDLKNPITSQEAIVLRSQIEIEGLEGDLQILKKQNKNIPLPNRIVNSCMDKISDWTNWVVQNQLKLIQLQGGKNKMDAQITPQMNAQQILDLTKEKQTQEKEEDLLGVGFVDLSQFELNF